MSSLKRSALGRGLDSLISMDDIQTGGSSAINEIELSQILPNPEQPRTWFDEESLEELASSIRELGITQYLQMLGSGIGHPITNLYPFSTTEDMNRIYSSDIDSLPIFQIYIMYIVHIRTGCQPDHAHTSNNKI